MDYRRPGGSGLKVPVLTFGTGTFGGSTDFFKPWEASDVKVVDAIDAIAAETGKTVPQIALNWLLQRPTVSTLVIQRGFTERNPPPV